MRGTAELIQQYSSAEYGRAPNERSALQSIFLSAPTIHRKMLCRTNVRDARGDFNGKSAR